MSYKRLIADKAYDANSLRKLLADQGAKAVIPSTSSRNQPIPYRKTIYRQRNHVRPPEGLQKDRYTLRQARKELPSWSTHRRYSRLVA